MLFKREEKLSGREIVLIARGEPDARGDFRLLGEEDAAAIEFSQDTAAEGKIANDVGFGANELVLGAVYPDFRGDARDGFLKHGVRMEVGIGIELEDIAIVPVDSLAPDPFAGEAFFHAINQLGAIFFLFLEFGVGDFRA